MKKSKLKNHKTRNPQSVICNLQSAICNPHGFTFIELAIVMVVLGLLIGLGANLVGPLIKRAKYTQSRGIVDAAVDSVVAYAAGTEDIPDNVLANASYFKKVVSNPNDAFARALVYFPDSSLSVAGDDKVCKQKTGEITVYTCNDSACSAGNFDTINNVAFVFVSGGSNMNVQTGNAVKPASIGTCPTTQCVTVYEQDTASIDDYAPDGNNADNYDDIVKWVTVNELRTKAGCTGPLIKILNNELPIATKGTAYTPTLFADGGIPFASGGNYEWCWMSSATLTNLTVTCNTTLAKETTACSLTSGTWQQCTSPTFSGTPNNAPGTGSYSLTFYVRDESDAGGTDDNIANKTFVITVNP